MNLYLMLMATEIGSWMRPLRDSCQISAVTLRNEKLFLLELLIWQDEHLGLLATCDLLASKRGEPTRK